MGHYDKFIEAQAEEIRMKRILKEVGDTNQSLELNNDKHSFMEPEFYDFLLILQMGAKKYARDNWLETDGQRSSHKDMHDSMFHHLAESFAGVTEDKDSKLHPLLHLAARSLMYYTRYKRNIVHSKDSSL